MITSEEAVFPNNLVECVALRLGLLDPDLFVTRRPLRETDPNQSIGVFGALWTPHQDSLEMKGKLSPGSSEPTFGRYVVTIQAFIKDTDDERGLATHSVLSALIRAILYRDEPLRDLIANLSVEVLGIKEVARRWGITQQRFLNNELESSWLFLSSIELWVDTEMM